MNRYIIGIDLGGTNTKISVFHFDSFENVYEKRFPTDAYKGSEAVMTCIYTQISSVFERFSKEEIVCIGMGIPGLLDIENGISKFSPNFPDWENVPVVDWLQERIHIPVYIDNDVRVNLYGEWFYGAGKDKKNIVLITLGTGLGSGIVMDGHVLYGQTESAGEIGHMHMFQNGRACKCGSCGCLGRYVSALGMLRTCREKIMAGNSSLLQEWVENNLDNLTAEMISKAYDLKDRVAIETMQETGEILGYGFVNIINLFNPEIIIVGGGMSAAGERLLSPARKIVKKHALKLSREHCEIVTAQIGDCAGMLGAAIYAKQRLQKGTRL